MLAVFAGADRAGHGCECGQDAVGRLEPMVPGSADAPGVETSLLIVLMLVEILHTVRISIRSHKLMIAEPFLVVGLIASIRRMLVITLEAATLSREGAWVSEGARGPSFTAR